MNAAPRIRPAGATDADAIAAIYNASIAAMDSTMDTVLKTGADIQALMQHFTPRETFLVLEHEALIQGWGIIKQYSDRPGYRPACETSVYLRRSARGRGYGSKIQVALLDQCRTFGYHHVVAKIWADNQVSLALHKKFGFTLVGVQREIGYLGGRWRDIAILQCILTDVPPPDQTAEEGR